MSLSPMREFHDQLNRLFSEWPLASRTGEWWGQEGSKRWLPPIEVSERDNDVLLKAEIPGIRPEDIHVDVEDNTVVISGETREEQREEKGSVFHSELRYGNFYRRVPLGTRVSPDRAEATCKNGVLTIQIPKAPEAGQRRIPVKT